MYQTEKNPVPNPAVQHVLPNILCYKSFLPHCLQIPAHLSAVPQYMKTNTEQQGGLICMQNLYNTVCKILQILSCEKYEIDPPQSPHSLLVHNMPLCPCPLPSFYRPTLESTQALGPQQAIVPLPTSQLFGVLSWSQFIPFFHSIGRICQDSFLFPWFLVYCTVQ